MLKKIHKKGVSIWLDYLSRGLMGSGELKSWIEEKGLRGLTSNPSIFEAAFKKDERYQQEILDASKKGADENEICWDIMCHDVATACDIFLPAYHSWERTDGFVSLELAPKLAHSAKESIEQAKKIWKKIAKPNLMIKVPATKAGLEVCEELIYLGMNVNVTLLFSKDRYREVREAFLTGLERRLKEDLPIKDIASVASFFISRVDGAVDPLLKSSQNPKAKELLGKIAVANARCAYDDFLVDLKSDRVKAILEAGGQMQRPLWASTSTKDPSYPDTLYVDELIGKHCVNTIPEGTLNSYIDHGSCEESLDSDARTRAKKELETLAECGIDLAEITDKLEKEGVEKFMGSFDQIIENVKSHMK